MLSAGARQFVACAEAGARLPVRRPTENRSAVSSLSGSRDAGTHQFNGPDAEGLQADLGPGLRVTTLLPGRFANAIQKNLFALHALQVIRDETTSAFVMSLEPDGSATVCRGWRYLSFNDGPEIHTSEHIREQLGYRGRWQSRGDWVYVEVTLDDTVCPRVASYSHLIPRHAAAWHLRCLPITPEGHPVLTMPALACRFDNVEPVFGEDEPHVVDGILPNRWLVLGAGNGLRIKVTSDVTGEKEFPDVQVEFALEPVRIGAWENSF